MCTRTWTRLRDGTNDGTDAVYACICTWKHVPRLRRADRVLEAARTRTIAESNRIGGVNRN